MSAGQGQEVTETKDDDDKASLVASFFGSSAGSGKQQSQTNNQSENKIPERASFEPEGIEPLSEEESDDEIERMIKAAEAELKEKRESAPPVPTR